MDENKLLKFVELMSKNISDSDLELVNLGSSLGLDLVSFRELRESQEDDFVDKIRSKALKIMKKNGDNLLSNKDLFYAGSIDFMVSDEPGGKKFFLLETNGGSNRGLSILSNKQQSIMYNGYFKAIEQAIESNKRGDGRILCLVGVPINDGLIHEKVIMLDYLRKKIREKGMSVKIYNVNNFSSDFEVEVAFLIADYNQLSTTISFIDNWVVFKEHARVSVLIGDGIARRLHDEAFSMLILEDFRKINSIIINPVFRITDDKSLTYLASHFARNELEKYDLKYLHFTKANTEEELIEKLKHLLKKYNKPFIIKPNGGSGGAGVVPIGPEQDFNELQNLIEKSKSEFFSKFMKNRNPYPYTIQEMAQFSLICPPWKIDKMEKHTFDVRIYMSQDKDGIIIPIGGLARIARKTYHGTLDKEEFVVNLSGFNGEIEVFRGRGISKKNAEILDLNKKDLVKIFSIGCILFASMANNYKKIISFNDWDKLIGQDEC
ncbi:MAG: hypothetical protein JW891_05460 [Candidatus Lokiarchaeota archaeon]|nr:hypothetical protein [Candidatus Lokiarchaeota archaeon]